MNIQSFSHSRKVTAGLIAIAAFVLAAGAFSAGEYVGYHKASFAFQNGNNFYHTFGPRGARPSSSGDFSEAHGTVGKVVSVSLPAITIADTDKTEKTIVVNDQTVIRRLRDNVTAQDIAVGDTIVAIGTPNAQSQIVANLIRIFPSQ